VFKRIVRNVFHFLSRGQFHQCFTSSFYPHRSQKHKKTESLTEYFAPLGSAHVKAAHRTLMKLTPGVDFTNVFARVFRTCFSYKRLFSSYVLVTSKKSARKTREKTLMKLTPGVKEASSSFLISASKYLLNVVQTFKCNVLCILLRGIHSKYKVSGFTPSFCIPFLHRVPLWTHWSTSHWYWLCFLFLKIWFHDQSTTVQIVATSDTYSKYHPTKFN